MSWRPSRSSAVLVFFLVAAVLWLVPLLPNPGGIAFWQGAEYSDLLITHWPNAFFLKHAIETWDQIPMWNPLILSGAPFLADPLSGVWYPPNWLTLLMPIQLAFNVLFWLHLAWTGWGMYHWMRRAGLGHLGAITAGIAWSGTPKWIAHTGLGHLGLITAISWTPWAMLCVHRTLDETRQNGRGWLRWAALTGIVLGLVFLADPRWFLPLGLLVVVYLLRQIAHSHAGQEDERLERIEIRRLGRAGMVAGLFTAGLASALGLPLLEFVRQTTRVGLSTQDLTTLSMPLSNLMGIFVPLSGQPEWVAFVGIVVLFMAMIAILGRQKGSWFWLSLVLASWLLALGNSTPLYGLIAKLLPGASLLRVPPRALFVAAFGLAVLAGKGVEKLLERGWVPADERRIRLGATAFTALAFLFNIGLWFLSEDRPSILLGIAGFAILGYLWFLVSRGRRLPERTINLGWVLLLGIELMCVNGQFLEVSSAEERLTVRREVIQTLVEEIEFERTFSPSYSLPQQTTAQAGLQLADGINPLQLEKTWDYMAAAVGFPADAYSVTLPPYPDGDPRQPLSSKLNAALLGRLSVRFVVADYPLEAENLILKFVTDDVYVYRNEVAMPRAWIQVGEGSRDWRHVNTFDWTPNRITIGTEGPGLLVLSEIDYPGWQVRVNGNLHEIRSVDGLLRGVMLPDGDHRVEFIFHPFCVYLGAALSLITCVLLVVLWIRR